MSTTTTLADLISTTKGELVGLFNLMEVAEEEIADAQVKHPDHADRIWHSFCLLFPTLNMADLSAIVYQAHCRELLDRVAAGADTRPGTAAEGCMALSTTSTVGPLTTTGAGLYMRLWVKAGLPNVMGEGLEHYEALRGSQMDDDERFLRAKLAQKERVLPNPIEHARYCPAGQAEAA